MDEVTKAAAEFLEKARAALAEHEKDRAAFEAAREESALNAVKNGSEHFYHQWKRMSGWAHFENAGEGFALAVAAAERRLEAAKAGERARAAKRAAAEKLEREAAEAELVASQHEVTSRSARDQIAAKRREAAELRKHAGA